MYTFRIRLPNWKFIDLSFFFATIFTYGHILNLFKSKSVHIMSTLRRVFVRDMQCQSGLSTVWVVISTITYWPAVHILLILSDCKTHYKVPGTPLCWMVRHTIELSSSLNTQFPEAFEWKHHSSHCVWVEPGLGDVADVSHICLRYEPAGRSWRWLTWQRIRELRWAESYLPNPQTLNEQPEIVLTSKNHRPGPAHLNTCSSQPTATFDLSILLVTNLTYWYSLAFVTYIIIWTCHDHVLTK